jgi:dCTP deaminase
MVLSANRIRDFVESGHIHIHPILDFDEQFETSKVDLRLDNKFYRMKAERETHHDSIEPFDYLFEEIYIPYKGPDAEFVLHPNEFALARTYEVVGIPEELMGRLGGRSSRARQGIVVHATASVVDPGFLGYITLELANFGSVPIKLHPLDRVAPITFEKIEGDVEPYKGDIRGVGKPALKKDGLTQLMKETLPDEEVNRIENRIREVEKINTENNSLS